MCLLYFFLSFFHDAVPIQAPSQMEALLMNSTAVYLKWKAPPLHAQNG